MPMMKYLPLALAAAGLLWLRPGLPGRRRPQDRIHPQVLRPDHRRQGSLAGRLQGQGPARGQHRQQVRLHPAVPGSPGRLRQVQGPGLRSPRLPRQRVRQPGARLQRRDQDLLHPEATRPPSPSSARSSSRAKASTRSTSSSPARTPTPTSPATSPGTSPSSWWTRTATSSPASSPATSPSPTTSKARSKRPSPPSNQTDAFQLRAACQLPQAVGANGSTGASVIHGLCPRHVTVRSPPRPRPLPPRSRTLPAPPPPPACPLAPVASLVPWPARMASDSGNWWPAPGPSHSHPSSPPCSSTA